MRMVAEGAGTRRLRTRWQQGHTRWVVVAAAGRLGLHRETQDAGRPPVTQAHLATVRSWMEMAA